MPIYLYEPTIFSEQETVNECCFFEVLQSLHDAPLQSCPICGHIIHRAITNFSIAKSKMATSYDCDPYTGLTKKNESSGAKAARIAMRHICKTGCSH